MRFLLDEQLHQRPAAALTIMSAQDGDEYAHLLDIGAGGLADQAIPQLCAATGFNALVTANFKDFGAKKVIYQALLAAGIHVVVLRPGKLRFTPDVQLSLLSMHRARIRTLLAEAPEPVLVRVTPNSAEVRSLLELTAEVEAGTKLP